MHSAVLPAVLPATVELPAQRGPRTELHSVPAAVPAAVPAPRPEHAAHPDSPVGRIAARLAADPTAGDPLRRLETRLGRALVDLTTVSDMELHALVGVLLEEKHRRAARWLHP